MSATSRIAFQRNAAQQPAANLYGPMAAAAVSAGSGTPPAVGPAPSTTSMASGAAPAGGTSINFVQAVVGIFVIAIVWWIITLVLERLLPLKDTPDFFRDWLHGLRMALIVAFWLLVWKMTAGVAPFNMSAPYVTIASAV